MHDVGGMLATWMRLKYPHILDGAIAGSAPIWTYLGEVGRQDIYIHPSCCLASITGCLPDPPVTSAQSALLLEEHARQCDADQVRGFQGEGVTDLSGARQECQRLRMQDPPYDSGSFAKIVTRDASEEGGSAPACSSNVRQVRSFSASLSPHAISTCTAAFSFGWQSTCPDEFSWHGCIMLTCRLSPRWACDAYSAPATSKLGGWSQTGHYETQTERAGLVWRCRSGRLCSS